MNSKAFSTQTASIIVFGLLFFTYASIHQLGEANQNTRLDLLHALVERGEWTIDAYHENTVDVSIVNGHYYSPKAPATILLSMPAFLVSRSILSIAGISIESPRGWWLSDWMTTAFSVGLLTALGGAALFLFLVRFVSRSAALVTTLALFLGAAPLPYATCLFAHSETVGLLCIALWLLECRCTSAWSSALAGLSAGLAAAGEFTAAPAAIGLFCWSLAKGRRAGGWFLLGSLPALLLIPAYNWIVFGGPFIFGYLHLPASFGIMHHQGFFGITFPPSPLKIAYLLLSPARGLFFWTPFLLLIIEGYRDLWRLLPRSHFLITVLVPIVQITLIGGFIALGGWALGPRYLSSMLPFLALPAALGWRRFPRLGTALAILSVLFTGLGTIVTATPSLEYTNPLLQLYIPRFLEGNLTPTIFSELGMHGIVSVLPIVLVVGGGVAVLWRGWAIRSQH